MPFLTAAPALHFRRNRRPSVLAIEGHGCRPQRGKKARLLALVARKSEAEG